VTPSVCLLVSVGYADWEPNYALAELRRSGGLQVETVGFAAEPVRSMGGVRVVFKHGRFPQPSAQPG
jgi:hypothetical protein